MEKKGKENPQEAYTEIETHIFTHTVNNMKTNPETILYKQKIHKLKKIKN